MSQELDDTRVFKLPLERLAVSFLVALPCASGGAALAYLLFPIIDGLGLTFFHGWGGFLWVELGALIFGATGFLLCWRRMKIRADRGVAP